MILSSCDFCERKNVFIREHFDKWGDHILNQCFYGCDDPKNIPNEPEETLIIKSVEKVHSILCYSTEWRITLSVNGRSWWTRLQLLNGETESSVTKMIQKCRNTKEVERLNKHIKFD
ncbi:hypothetical protein [Paenibacillus shenyangensis]|uniref:hypothetical protein n=1 Tax=Paenibacillus sp. A9 TaxID=1284352 RepID=UPI00036956DC|nr:hypothetical protein [Paenibacillus sp. A9]